MGIQEGKKIVKSKHLKRAGIILASVSSAALVIILMFAIFKTGSSGGFTIRIDTLSEKNHVTMSDSPDGKSTTLLNAEPVRNMFTTTAKTVEDEFLSTFTVDNIGGAHNMEDTVSGRNGYKAALMYTVFLNNTGSEVQRLWYELQIDRYVEPSNGAKDLFEYARMIVQTSEGLESLTNEANTQYFARHNNEELGTTEGADDDREAISTHIKTSDTLGNTVRESTYSGMSNDKFCTNFNEDEGNNILFSHYVDIKPNSVLRFTFVMYLEGEDPDCYGKQPEDSVLLMSLNFGSK